MTEKTSDIITKEIRELKRRIAELEELAYNRRHLDIVMDHLDDGLRKLLDDPSVRPISFKITNNYCGNRDLYLQVNRGKFKITIESL